MSEINQSGNIPAVPVAMETPIAATPVSAPPVVAPKPKSKLPLILGGLFMLVLLAAGIGIGFFFANQTKQNAVANNNTTGNEQPTETTDLPTEVDSESRRVNKVVYVTQGNVWVINADGSNKQQITKDGSAFAADRYYTKVAWQDEENFSYTKCTQGSCDIYSYDLATSAEKLTRTVGAELVEAMSWSNDGKTLAYYYTDKATSVRKLDLLTGDSVKTALNFPKSTLGRDGNVNDGVEITFSNDDQTFMFFNTILNDEPAADEVPITIINRDGTIKQKIAGDYTFGTFISSSDVFYKRLIDIDLFSTKQGIIVNDFFGLSLDISNDGKQIAYYEYDETTGKTTLHSIDLATKQITKLGDNLTYPKWLNTAELVANQAKPVPSNEIIRFDRMGLVKLNTLNKEVTTLETQPVYEFDVLGD